VTRIIGGSAGGRPIAVPPGKGTRPTSGRAREGLFSTLATLVELRGARVLDLYAGSGALGLEALSRGASHVTLVESGPGAVAALRANVHALALLGAEVNADRVERVVAAGPPPTPYGVVLADPPYALAAPDLATVLRALVEREWLAAGAVLAVERASRADPLRWPAGIEAVRDRRYGEGTLWYGRAAPPARPPMSRTDRTDAR